MSYSRMIDDIVLFNCPRRFWTAGIGQIGIRFGRRKLVVTLGIIWHSDSVPLSVSSFYQATILERKHGCSKYLVSWTFWVIRKFLCDVHDRKESFVIQLWRGSLLQYPFFQRRKLFRYLPSWKVHYDAMAEKRVYVGSVWGTGCFIARGVGPRHKTFGMRWLSLWHFLERRQRESGTFGFWVWAARWPFLTNEFKMSFTTFWTF